jgi:hypothetical protein
MSVGWLARRMDAPLALAPQYAERAWSRRATGEADAPASPAGEREAARTAENAERAPTRGASLLTVSNHHITTCGAPPTVDGDIPGTYVGYFANEHGEQAVYTYDDETGEATIRMGEAGWHDVHRVHEGPSGGARAHRKRGAVAARLLARAERGERSPDTRDRRRTSPRLRSFAPRSEGSTAPRPELPVPELGDLGPRGRYPKAMAKVSPSGCPSVHHSAW